MEPLKYLTDSVEERNKLFNILPWNEGKDPKKIRPTPAQNEMEQAKHYIQKFSDPLWRFLKYILNDNFKNYVLMCDSEMELKTVIR